VYLDSSSAKSAPGGAYLRAYIKPGGGSFSSAQSHLITEVDGTPISTKSWKAFTFSGLTYNQSQLDGLVVRLQLDWPTPEEDDYVARVFAYAVILEVTYEPASEIDTTKGFFALMR
jgi:hypothetical protein